VRFKHLGAGYVRYNCRSCADGCVTTREQPHARYRECELCHSAPVLDRGEPVDQLHPDLIWAANALRSGPSLFPYGPEQSGVVATNSPKASPR
jgi:hypothetical protein